MTSPADWRHSGNFCIYQAYFVTLVRLQCRYHTLFSIDGYNCESAHRSSRRGGGVSLYIKEHIGYKQRSDLDILNEIMESKFIEIDKKYVNTQKM